MYVHQFKKKPKSIQIESILLREFMKKDSSSTMAPWKWICWNLWHVCVMWKTIQWIEFIHIWTPRAEISVMTGTIPSILLASTSQFRILLQSYCVHNSLSWKFLYLFMRMFMLVLQLKYSDLVELTKNVIVSMNVWNKRANILFSIEPEMTVNKILLHAPNRQIKIRKKRSWEQKTNLSTIKGPLSTVQYHL